MNVIAAFTVRAEELVKVTIIPIETCTSVAIVHVRHTLYPSRKAFSHLIHFNAH